MHSVYCLKSGPILSSKRHLLNLYWSHPNYLIGLYFCVYLHLSKIVNYYCTARVQIFRGTKEQSSMEDFFIWKNYGSYYRSERLRVWTILNNLIYIEHFLYLYQSILVCLDLSWFIFVYLGSAGLTYFYLLWSISGYIELSKAILDKNWISQAI